jgi:hypothetical protein
MFLYSGFCLGVRRAIAHALTTLSSRKEDTLQLFIRSLAAFKSSSSPRTKHITIHSFPRKSTPHQGDLIRRSITERSGVKQRLKRIEPSTEHGGRTISLMSEGSASRTPARMLKRRELTHTAFYYIFRSWTYLHLLQSPYRRRRRSSRLSGLIMFQLSSSAGSHGGKTQQRSSGPSNAI